jgi:hypothetical protein
MSPTSNVIALQVFDHGAGPQLYAAGAIDGFVQRWTGSAWAAVPNGPNAEVRALAVFDDGTGPALYAAGEFAFAGGAQVNSIARWNGTTWTGVGGGIGGFGIALTVFDDGSGPALYLGGNFTMTGSGPAARLAKWNGQSWSQVGTGIPNGGVNALEVFDDGTGPALYVGGSFTPAGAFPGNRLVKWNGSAWSSVGGGTSATVLALESFNDGTGPALYAAGFMTANGTYPYVVRKWTSGAWSTVGTGFNGTIAALTVFDDGTGTGPLLYAGGDFSVIAGPSDVTTGRISKWNGSSWVPLAVGANSGIHAFARFDNAGVPTLWMGGTFSNVGGAATFGIARWSGCAPDAPIPGDLNGDGVVDGADLGILLGQWDGAGTADLNSDGTVDGADLGILLANW